MKALRFGVPFLFLASAPAGFLLGGPWAFLTLVLTPLALATFDVALGFDEGVESEAAGIGYRALLWAYIVVQIAVTIWAAIQVTEPATSLLAGVGLTVSVGLTSGIFGIVAAHEMVHSQSRVERGLGLTFFAGLGYMHFRIAHVHGHHVRAATPEDPASARRGESAYAFIVRSVAGQAREAWAFERKRRLRRGRPVLGVGNRMLLYLVAELLVLAAATSLSFAALAFWIGQAVLAVLMLELFNYIAHYGLARRRGPGGAYERLAPRHSWNSTRRMNNWALFNMGRHSDHHCRPTRPYQRLEPEAGAPELPSGYAGAILMCLIPPVWRRVMDRRVDAWMSDAAAAG